MEPQIAISRMKRNELKALMVVRGIPRAPGMKKADCIAALSALTAPIARAPRVPLPHPASQEQQRAIDAVARGESVIIDAVAGSGKTTFVLHLAAQYPAMQFMLLTYNRRLSDETKERARHHDIANLRVFTFHGFASRFYGAGTVHEDRKLAQLRSAQLVALPHIDCLITDETQDMVPEFFYLVRKIARTALAPRMCVIGDAYQMIYEFKGADSRFITCAEELHEIARMTRAPFTTSYRCTHEIARFVNSLIGHERIRAVRAGPRPILAMIDEKPWSDSNAQFVVALVRRMVAQYGNEGVFILAPSVKVARKKRGAHRAFGSPITRVVNALSRSGIDMFVQSSDEQDPNPKHMIGKVAVITYHKSKGLERECAIVLAFDNSYFEFYSRDSDPTLLSNAQYVAVTRARQQLVVVQRAGHALPFARDTAQFCDVMRIRGAPPTLESFAPLIRAVAPPPVPVRVTDLLRYIPADVVAHIMSIIAPRVIRPADPAHEITLNHSTTSRNGLTESVADITGTAITLAHATRCDIHSAAPVDILARYPGFAWSFANSRAIMQSAACLCADFTGFEHRLIQITSWDWLPQPTLDELVARMRGIVGTRGIAEHFVEREFAGATVHGMIDWIAGDTTFEIKCTESLSDENIIQLAMYAALTRDDDNTAQRYILFNARTFETIEVPAHPSATFNEIARILIDCKSRAGRQDDATFIATHREIARAIPSDARDMREYEGSNVV
jgi:hypothetical protein